MKNVKKTTQSKKSAEKINKKFSDAQKDLDRMIEQIRPFKIKSVYSDISTEGKWFETSSTIKFHLE